MTIDFSNSNLLVCGDVMLDRYWIGDTTRISPEAPVPVVRMHQVRETPGGAANVAANIANLGAKVTLLSVIGNDHDGDALEGLIRNYGVNTLFVRDRTLPTTLKVRVVARGQQIVRADFEGRPDHELLLPLVSTYYERVRSVGAVVVSDYGKGGLIHVRQMIEHATGAGKYVLVDPKGTDYTAYRRATTITPNLEEFARVVGTWRDASDFESRAFALVDDLELMSLLVTRSEDGMSLFLEGKHIHIPAQTREVFDVSGAGDTVIATMATAMASGYDIEAAARLANVAAGIVVGKSGTTPITLEELLTHV